MEYIPVKFGVVKGNFSCRNNNLKTLKGCPDIVEGYFDCYSNQLTNLKEGPYIVGGDLWCYDNPITDFENLDFEVGENIIFTPIKGMEYLDKYRNSVGEIFINFNEFKNLWKLKRLNESLNNDLSIKPVKIRHKI